MKREGKSLLLIFAVSFVLILSISFVSASLLGDVGNFLNKFLSGKITGNVVSTDGFDNSIDVNKWSQVSLARPASIQSGKLQAVGTADDYSNSESGVTSSGKWKLSGDFDIQVDYDATIMPDTTGKTSSFAAVAGIWLAGPTNNYLWSITKLQNNNYQYLVWSNQAGVYKSSAGTSSGKLRITRTGNIIKVYSWSGSSWAEYGSITSADTGDMTVSLKVYDNVVTGNAQGIIPQAYFDNFIINSGSVINLVVCTPSWVTGSWSTCSGGTQSRSVTDSNNCGVSTGKPATSQSCTVIDPCASKNCDDGNLCTTDSCSNGNCVNTQKSCPSGQSCSNGNCISSAPAAKIVSYYVPTTPVKVGDKFQIKCDFGLQWLGCVIAKHGNDNCTYKGYEGTNSLWECTAKTAGTINNYCNLFDYAGETRVKCAVQTNQIASIAVIASCVSKTCSGLGKNCGSVDNGCGTILNCGSCTGSQTCSNGVCVSPADPCANKNCNDNNACTDDSCSNGNCVNTVVKVCLSGQSCSNGVCVSPADPCANKNCDDGNLCTTDSCSNGNCVNTAKVCPSGQSCTNGNCIIISSSCTPNWVTGSWSTCSGGTRTRTLTDSLCSQPAKTESEPCSSVTQTCTDSDEGLNYTVYGKASANGNIQTDSCINDYVVNEKYCSGVTINSQTKICPNGCKDGKCIINIDEAKSIKNTIILAGIYPGQNARDADITISYADKISSNINGLSTCCNIQTQNSQMVNSYHSKGYLVFTHVGTKEEGLQSARDGIDVIMFDEVKLMSGQNGRPIAFSGAEFNNIKNQIKEINPNAKVGIVEAFVDQYNQWYSEGANPEVIGLEQYLKKSGASSGNYPSYDSFKNQVMSKFPNAKVQVWINDVGQIKQFLGKTDQIVLFSADSDNLHVMESNWPSFKLTDIENEITKIYGATAASKIAAPFILKSSYVPTTPIKIGETFQIKCDFGVQFLGCMQAYHNGVKCDWGNKWEGSTGTYNCVATTAGVIENRCDLLNMPDIPGCAPQTNQINSLTVIDPNCVSQPLTTTCGSSVCGDKNNNCGVSVSCGTCEGENTCSEGVCVNAPANPEIKLVSSSVSPTSVRVGDKFQIKCDYGLTNLGCVIAKHGEDNCTYKAYEGTNSIWECTAKTAGTINNYCNLFGYAGETRVKCAPQTVKIQSIKVKECADCGGLFGVGCTYSGCHSLNGCYYNPGFLTLGSSCGESSEICTTKKVCEDITQGECNSNACGLNCKWNESEGKCKKLPYIPNCANKNCGGDGGDGFCGNLNGECPSGQICSYGNCVNKKSNTYKDSVGVVVFNDGPRGGYFSDGNGRGVFVLKDGDKNIQFEFGGLRRVSLADAEEIKLGLSRSYAYGSVGLTSKVVIAGDWDGDGKDSVGYYDPYLGRFELKNSNTPGNADITFAFRSKKINPADYPVAGDWDGDGKDSVGLYDFTTGTFYLKNSNSAGNADIIYQLPEFMGGSYNFPVAGDWDGDGKTDVGVLKGDYYGKNNFYLVINQTTNLMINTSILDLPNPATSGFMLPIAGDFNGDGRDGIGLYNFRKQTFYLKDNFDYGDSKKDKPNNEIIYYPDPYYPDLVNTVCRSDGYAGTFYVANACNYLPIVGNWNNKELGNCILDCNNKICGDDGCGGSSCGTCKSNQICLDNGKKCQNCISKTCESLGGKQCGKWDDGCEKEIDCGKCNPLEQICSSDGKCINMKEVMTNVLLNKKITTNIQSSTGSSPNNAIDGNVNTIWQINEMLTPDKYGNYPKYFNIDLESEYNIINFKFICNKYSEYGYATFYMKFYDSNMKFIGAGYPSGFCNDKNNPIIGEPTPALESSFIPSEPERVSGKDPNGIVENVRFIKFYITTYGTNILEIQVNGAKSEVKPIKLVRSSVPATVNKGETFQMKCDFGVQFLGCMQATHNGVPCTWGEKWEGSAGVFNCVADTAGVIENTCELIDNPSITGCVAQQNKIQSTTVR